MQSKHSAAPSGATNNGNASNIYVIIDSVTNRIVGGLQQHINDKSAIRTVQHILQQESAVVALNPEDFELWQIGSLDEHHHITGERRIILAGTQIETMSNTIRQQQKGA